MRHLPCELQDQIWEAAVNAVGPRLVELRDDYRGLEEQERLGKLESDRYHYNPTPKEVENCRHFGLRGSIERADPYFTSNCAIPALLHTCRQSRTAALRRWKLSLARWRHDELWQSSKEILDDSRIGPHLEARVFFDFESDVLLGQFLFSAERGVLNSQKDIKRLRRIVLDTWMVLKEPHNPDSLLWALEEEAPNLAKLYISCTVPGVPTEYRVIAPANDAEFVPIWTGDSNPEGSPVLRPKVCVPEAYAESMRHIDAQRPGSAFVIPEIEFIEVLRSPYAGKYC